MLYNYNVKRIKYILYINFLVDRTSKINFGKPRKNLTLPKLLHSLRIAIIWGGSRD